MIAYPFHIIGDPIIGDTAWQGDVPRGFGISTPGISIIIWRIGYFHIMLGGIDDVVVQRLPCGTGLWKTVRIRRSHAQAEGKEEGEDSFLML